MANLASRKRLLKSQRDDFIVLILYEKTFHFFILILDMLDHLGNLDSTNNRVCTSNSWNNISGHIFNFIECLFLNIETMHSKICSACDKVNNVIVIFFESYHPILNFLFC
jgi:hypothetical protein